MIKVMKTGRVHPTDTIILPLLIENNTTVVGTASVLEQFGEEFKVPYKHSKIVLPFDEKLKSFSIEAARRH